MEPMMSERRGGAERSVELERKDSSPPPNMEFPESERRRLGRSSEDEVALSSEAPSMQRIEELPTEPHHALPTYPDMDWDAPTIPDGKTLDSWDIDERG